MIPAKTPVEAEPVLRVLHADDALLVIDKPAGLLSVPGRGADKQDCVASRIQAIYPEALVVHRLDMATSGLLLMARGQPAQRALSAAFAERAVHKRYVAVVSGTLASPNADWAVIDLPIVVDWPRRPLRVIDAIHGKPSVTHWRVLPGAAPGTTRLSLSPLTGRSHQLRVHLQAIGHPILGDVLYGDALSAQRLLLHASVLELPHPLGHGMLRFESPPPF